MTTIEGAEPACAGLLLAGGGSSRMGRPKALLPIPCQDARDEGMVHSRPLIADQILRLALAGCAPVACVLGADAGEIVPVLQAPVLPPLPARLIIAFNEDWRRGSFSSLQIGLRSLGEWGRGVILLPLDVPGISPGVFACLCAAAAESLRAPDPAAAIIPVHRGRGGHPLWLAPATAAGLLGEPAEARLDERLRAMRVLRIEVADPRVLDNVNTPEEWEICCRSLEAR